MSQSTEKSLGQVAHETGERVGRWARRWSDMGPSQRDEWEQIAQVVAAVVREQAERRFIEEKVSGLGDFGRGFNAGVDSCVIAIRSMKP